MITAGKNPFELSATSGHLGTAASALRDAIDDLRLLGVNLNVLGMLLDAQKLCSNLAQQIDKAAETELMRVNAEPVCPACDGMGVNMTVTLDPTSAIKCPTCHGEGVA